MHTSDHISFWANEYILEKCNIISCNYIVLPFRYKNNNTINKFTLWGGKWVCERLEFRYELFTSYDTLDDIFNEFIYKLVVIDIIIPTNRYEEEKYLYCSF